MRVGLWLLSLSLLAAQEHPLPPGTPAASPQPEVKSGEECSVEGIVLNARTRAPLSKAQVRLLKLEGPAAGPGSATTDASGRFKLSGVAPGQYRALASRSGFVRQVFGSGGAFPSLTLAPGQALAGLTLELSPAAVIAGRVVDEDGEPLANVRLQAFRCPSSQGSRQFLPVGRSVSTDDQGGYRLSDLDRGRYFVSAAYSPPPGPTAGAPSAAPAEVGVALAFYPGTADPAQAVPIQLRAGDERRGVDFRLAPPHIVRVRGRLVPAPERPQEVVLALAPLAGGAAGMFASGPQPSAHIDASGAFEFRGVTSGSYALTAVSEGNGNRHRGHLLVEAASDNIDGLELAIKPAVELEGRVRFDADSHPDIDLTKLTVTLVPVQPGFGLMSSSSAPDTGGSFKFPGVYAGDYLVRLGNPGGDNYLKTVTYGGADANGKPLNIGDAPAPIDLVLAAGGGQVQGVVTDNAKPAAGVLVLAVPGSGREDLVRFGRTDPSGRFSLRGLAPGDYTLCAFDDLPEGSVADPAGVKAYGDKGKEIAVAEKSQTTADLALIHTQDE